MSSETSLAEPATTDVPPRTWRGWWLARPKWLRIACWGIVAVFLLHVALAVRIAIGLVEDPAITKLRREGVLCSYRGDAMRARRPGYGVELFPGHGLLVEGFVGRSRQNVLMIHIFRGAEGVVEQCVTQFPRVFEFSLQETELSPRQVQSISKLHSLRTLAFHDCRLSDADMKHLAQLPNLEELTLRGANITDAALADLQQMKSLRRIELSQTDVSLAAIQRWRIDPAAAQLTINTNKEHAPGDLAASIRWSDGRFALDAGRYLPEFTWEGPLDVPSSKQVSMPPRSFTRGPPGATADLLWDTSQILTLADGEYRLRLKIKNCESEPVVIQMKGGQASPGYFEFEMPATKQEALGSKP